MDFTVRGGSSPLRRMCQSPAPAGLFVVSGRSRGLPGGGRAVVTWRHVYRVVHLAVPATVWTYAERERAPRRLSEPLARHVRAPTRSALRGTGRGPRRCRSDRRGLPRAARSAETARHGRGVGSTPTPPPPGALRPPPHRRHADHQACAPHASRDEPCEKGRARRVRHTRETLGGY